MATTKKNNVAQQGRKGFTLQELLVSISILALITGLMVANFHRGQLSDNLRISAQTLASNLRRVQNLSTVGQSILIAGNQRVPPGGYGASFLWQLNQSQYTLFADISKMVVGICTATNPNDANSEYDPGAAPECDPAAEAGTMALKPDVIFSAIKVGAGVKLTFGTGGVWDTYNNRVDLAFKPPKPLPVLDGVVGKTVQIELKHTKTNQYRTITIIGPSGQISEQVGAIAP